MKKDFTSHMTNKLKIGLALLLTLLAVIGVACTNILDPDNKTITETPVPVDSENISFITPAPDAHREELDAILLRSTMLDGVTINGVSVGGMSVSEAREAVRAELNKNTKPYAVNVSFGGETVSFSGETIPVTDNLDAVVDEAFNIVREDNGFEAVSQEVESIRTAGRDFSVSVHFEEASLKGAIEAFAAEHDVAPVNASVAYDKEVNGVAFTDDVPGKSVDKEALFTAMLAANDGDTVEAPIIETAAEVTSENVKDKFVLRGKMTTNFQKSNKNRKFNVCKGAGMITGTVLHPGEVFSANGTLGVRNKANGWKTANAYVAGGHEKQYGGGVCQLSTTLYNAAVMADMKIVDRRNHSMPVDYIPKGLDATINSVGNQIDFKFENSSKSDIIIIAYVDNDDYTKAGLLTMEIWGIPISEDSNGKYDEIRIPEPKKLKTLKPTGDVEYRVDETKKPGYKEQIVKNQNGSVWQSYVEYYLNGELVERKELAQSTYKAFKAVYIVGPDATPEPDPTQKPDKTESPDTTPKTTPKPSESSDPDPTKSSDTPKPTKEPEEDTPKPTKAPEEDTPKPTKAPEEDTPKPTKAPDTDTPKPSDSGDGE